MGYYVFLLLRDKKMPGTKQKKSTFPTPGFFPPLVGKSTSSTQSEVSASSADITSGFRVTTGNFVFITNSEENIKKIMHHYTKQQKTPLSLVQHSASDSFFSRVKQIKPEIPWLVEQFDNKKIISTRRYISSMHENIQQKGQAIFLLDQYELLPQVNKRPFLSK